MNGKKRVLICEFSQESNTFNPLATTLENFQMERYLEGQVLYNTCKALPCAFHGMIDAIEEADGEAIATIALKSGSGGKVADDVFQLLLERMRFYLADVGDFDAVFASLHGATCTESEEDACGAFLTFLREQIGQEKPIAVSCDLHANVTETMLRCADIVCGYQTYPHLDFYETGYRAASLGMRKLAGQTIRQASTILPMMVPPAGYTNTEEPFKSVIDYGKSLVANGTLLDFTVFQVQPWLDIADIGSTIVAVAEDESVACRCADELAARLFAIRDGCWPEMLSIDEIIDRAEDPQTPKPVILVDAADSPNGGAVGDSVAVALRLRERGSTLRTGMFVKDPEAVKQAFRVGVGQTATFVVGAKFTPDSPGPLQGEARVRSLHDGIFRSEGPASKGTLYSVGLAAVLSFDSIDMMVCEQPAASGDPQVLRHFGIEPKLYDLIVVKANTSFRAPYSAFAGVIYNADTPGAGASNLRRFTWKNLPKNFYPHDIAPDYVPAPAQLRRK